MSKDLFSKQADQYAKYRPSYPEELIQYIISFVKEKKLAWDCATGNGQAAVLLAPYFEKIIATDFSEKQIALAVAKGNIQYAVCPAEKTPFPDNSFDLITVAQAYHWITFDVFAKEVKRVAKENAVIAIWGYNIPQCNSEKINQVIQYFYKDVVGRYWDAERKYVDEAYQTVLFPFEELPSQPFRITVHWNKDDLTGYFNSWSSLQHFIKANTVNPVDSISEKINAQWPDEEIVTFHFPVFMRIGRIRK